MLSMTVEQMFGWASIILLVGLLAWSGLGDKGDS